MVLISPVVAELLQNANLCVFVLHSWCLRLSPSQAHNTQHNPVDYNNLMHSTGTLSEARGSDLANSMLQQSQGSLGFPPPYIHMARNQQGGGGLGEDGRSRQSGGTSPGSQPSPTLKSTQLPATILQGSPPFSAHHAAMHPSGGQFVGEPMQTAVQPNAQQVNLHQFQYPQQMRQPVQHSSQQHPYYVQVQMHPSLVYRQQPPGNMPMYTDGYLPTSHMQQGQVESHLGTMPPGSSLQPAPPSSTIRPVVDSANHLSPDRQSQQLPLQYSMMKQQQGQTQHQWSAQQQQHQARTRNIMAIIDPKTGLDITKARREQGGPKSGAVSAADQPPESVQESSKTTTQVTRESAAAATPETSAKDSTAASKAKEFYDMVAAAAGKSGVGSSETNKPKTTVGSLQGVGSPKPNDDFSHSTVVVGDEKSSSVHKAPLSAGETDDDASFSFGNFGSEDLPPSSSTAHNSQAAKSGGVVTSELPCNSGNQKYSTTATISFIGELQEIPQTGRDQPKEENNITHKDKKHDITTESVNLGPPVKDSTSKVIEDRHNGSRLPLGVAAGNVPVVTKEELNLDGRLVGDSNSANVPDGDAAATLKDTVQSEASPPTAALSAMKVDNGLPKATDDNEKRRSPEAIVKESSSATPDKESVTQLASRHGDTTVREDSKSLEQRASELDQMKTTAATTALPSQSSTSHQPSAATAAGRGNRMVPRRSNMMDFSGRSLRPGGGGLRPGGTGKVSPQSTSHVPAATDAHQTSSSSPVLGGGISEKAGTTTVDPSSSGKLVYTLSELRQFSTFSERPQSLPSMDLSDIGRGGGGGDRVGVRGGMGGAYRNERYGGDVRSVSHGGAVPSGGGSFPDGRSQYASDSTVRGGVGGGRPGGEPHGAPPGYGMVGGPDWKRGQRLPPHEKQNVARGGPYRGGDNTFDGPIEPLKKGENRWKPTKDNTPVEEARKKMQSILNKMTRERFDRLSQQLIDIKIESLEMLNIMVRLVFDKAVEEHHFVDMYADLCSRLVQESRSWSFVKAIYNMDANQWCWTPDVGKDKTVVGPFDSLEEALEFARKDDADIEPIPCPFEMELVAFRIFSGKVVKIMQGKESNQVGELYIVYLDEKKGRKDYQISDQAFGTEDEALQHAARRTALLTLLLCQCQIEFEKDDMYENLVKEEEEFKATNASSMDKKLFDEKAEDFAENRIKMKRRIVGNIQFIGELYKKDLMKEKIIHECCCRLLNAEITNKGTCSFVNNNNSVDEEKLECLCKMLTSTGKKVSSAKQGKRVGEYFRLLEKICKDKEKTGVSSRIIFMIKDLSDLRENNWTPRHQVEKAKTLDELHKQAASDERNRIIGGMGGGRNDPGRSISHGGMNSRDRDFERDRERDRIRQGAGYSNSPSSFQDTISGSLRNTMGRGDSGRITPGAPISRTPSGGGSSSLPSSSGIRDRGGGGVGGGRQQGQYYSPTGLPSSSQQQPLTSQAPPPTYPTTATSTSSSSISSEKIERLVKSLIDEFLTMKDVKEAVECLNELPAMQGPRELVRAIAIRCMDGKPSDRPLLLELMTSLFQASAIDPRATIDGLFPALEQLDYISIDQPQASHFLAELLAVVFKEGKVEMKPIVLQSKEKCTPSTLGKLFASLLFSLMDSMGPLEARNQLRARGFNLPDLYASKDEGMKFLDENNLWALSPSMKVHKFIASDPSAVDLNIQSALTIVERCSREMGQDVSASEEWADSITQILLMKSAVQNLQSICGGTPNLDLFKALKSVSSQGGNLTERGCLWGAYHTCIELKEKNRYPLNDTVIPLFKLLLKEKVVTVESYKMWRVDMLRTSRIKEEEAIASAVLKFLDPVFAAPSG